MSAVQGAIKKAKKNGQFSGSVGAQPVSMVSINFVGTTDQP